MNPFRLARFVQLVMNRNNRIAVLIGGEIARRKRSFESRGPDFFGSGFSFFGGSEL
jgi:hypothetical protein